MKCDVHKDRGGILFVDLPSIGVRRWGCLECRQNFEKSMLSNSPRLAARNGRNPWPNYDSRDDRSTDSRLLRHEHDGTYKTHYVDRSKEK